MAREVDEHAEGLIGEEGDITMLAGSGTCTITFTNAKMPTSSW